MGGLGVSPPKWAPRARAKFVTVARSSRCLDSSSLRLVVAPPAGGGAAPPLCTVASCPCRGRGFPSLASVLEWEPIVLCRPVLCSLASLACPFPTFPCRCPVLYPPTPRQSGAPDSLRLGQSQSLTFRNSMGCMLTVPERSKRLAAPAPCVPFARGAVSPTPLALPLPASRSLCPVARCPCRGRGLPTFPLPFASLVWVPDGVRWCCAEREP